MGQKEKRAGMKRHALNTLEMSQRRDINCFLNNSLLTYLERVLRNTDKLVLILFQVALWVGEFDLHPKKN